ncbi:hypothetical protein MML48_1g05212 [Holotrichia oblita]|uniref:Uncharacterized protein n=1 Tax=Holotrichia oblita TaxID=644536 RepID=A0ACB9TTX1_HOLOL|nr:hypothetical protein MML48_1g05212 [Holotrichia oblita]
MPTGKFSSSQQQFYKLRKMKRNEFLMRLATENKLAIVSDDVAVIQLPYDYQSAIPKRTVSFTSQSQLNNNSTAPLRDLLPNISKCVELQEPQLTQSLTSVSTTPENASADGTFSPTGRVSSLAQKTLKERQWEKPVELPLTSDILTIQTYINDLAENAYKKLNNEHNEYKDIRINYKILTECVLAHTVMFNRKRIGDVQLPQDIFQTAKVAKVLLLLEKGKGKEFRGKSLSEIELGRDAYYSSESDEDDTLSSIRPALEDALNPTTSTENESLQQEDIRNNKEFEKVIEHLEEGIEGNFSAIQPADISTEDEEAGKSVTTKAIIKKGPDSKNVSGRTRWTIQEKQCVLKYFQLHLKKKLRPRNMNVYNL